MMIKEYLIEILLLVVLAGLAFGYINPYFMPMGMVFIGLSVLVSLFATFVVLMWREAGADEREEQIITKADRVGFLAGAAVLIAAVVYDTWATHYVNDWILGALFAMLIGKVVASIYFNSK